MGARALGRGDGRPIPGPVGRAVRHAKAALTGVPPRRRILPFFYILLALGILCSTDYRILDSGIAPSMSKPVPSGARLGAASDHDLHQLATSPGWSQAPNDWFSSNARDDDALTRLRDSGSSPRPTRSLDHSFLDDDGAFHFSPLSSAGSYTYTRRNSTLVALLIRPHAIF